MKKKVIILFSMLIVVGALLMGCSAKEEPSKETQEENISSDSETPETPKKALKIGTTPVTSAILNAAIPSMESLGYEVEEVMFDDFVVPNVALEEGSIDANIIQHGPYLDQFNQNNGTNIVPVARVATGLTGFYSNKYESAESIPEGGRIGIFQDPSNQDRALRMLEELELVELKQKDGLYSLLDIDKNVKNLEFITMDVNQLITGIDDLDACFIPRVQLFSAGVEPKNTISIESSNENSRRFSIVLAVKEENQNEEWIKDFLEAFDTQATKDSLFDQSKGNWEHSLEIIK